MSVPEHVTIVGASLAGVRCIRWLRRRGFDGTVTLIGAEPHLAYDRPPLSKQFLAGQWEPETFTLEDEDFYADLDLRLGVRATGLDPRQRQVALDDGGAVTTDAVVVATGATPRTLPGAAALDGVHVLRTLDDARTLRDAFAAGPRVVVVGAGFIGSEVAATARRRGLDVTVVEALPQPVVRGFGPVIGEVLADLHRDEGVDLRLGVGVEGFDGDDRVEAVRLSDGQRVPADLVVVGIGVAPEVGWLKGSGVELRDGVVCDGLLRARGVEGVWAAGDVTRWPHGLYGEELRIEHWTNASEQGGAVARNLLAGPEAAEPFAPVPYVWSDQYDANIQVWGHVRGDDEVVFLHGRPEDRKFVAGYFRDGRLHGAVGLNWAKFLIRYRPLLQELAPREQVETKRDELEAA